MTSEEWDTHWWSKYIVYRDDQTYRGEAVYLAERYTTEQFGPECHACPGNFDEDGDIVHPQWPCPTWKLIEQEEV